MFVLEWQRTGPKMHADNKHLDRLAYTVREACAVSTIGRTRMYQLIAEKRVESRLVGKRRLIIAASLHRLLEIGA